MRVPHFQKVLHGLDSRMYDEQKITETLFRGRTGLVITTCDPRVLGDTLGMRMGACYRGLQPPSRIFGGFRYIRHQASLEPKVGPQE